MSNSARSVLLGAAVVVVVLALAAGGFLLTTTNSSPPPPPVPGEWTLVFEDDFDGPSRTIPEGINSSAWGAYSGPAAGNKCANWDPKNAVIEDGNLVLKVTEDGDRYLTGGVSNGNYAQTYGKWEVRMFMPPTNDAKFVIQLWPSASWPPEIDFAEGYGLKRHKDGYSAYLHWGDVASQEKGKRQQTVDNLRGIDMDGWRTVGVQWRPGLVEYTIDGRVWATVVGSPPVPDEDMWLAIQEEATSSVADSAGTPPPLRVDSVRVWSWEPTEVAPSG